MSMPEDARPDRGRRDPGSPGPEGGVTEAPEKGGAGTRGGASRLRTALAAGFVAGLLAWIGGEGIVAIRTADQTFVPANQGQIARLDALVYEATILKSTASFAVLGAALGLAMGIAGGWCRRSPRAAATAGLVGALIGGAATAGASWVALPMFLEDTEPLGQSMLVPILMHGLLWAAAGLAGGLAFAMGLGGRPAATAQAAVGGLIGAVLGAAIYDIVGAIALATENTGMPLSEGWASRLLARMCVTVAAAIISVAVLDPGRPEAAPPSRPQGIA